MLAFSLCEMDELAEAVMNRLFDGIDARADEVFGGPRYMTAWKRFSVSDHLAATALDDWVPDKEKGNACYKDGQYREAMALYSQAIAACPSHGACYGNRAATWMMMHQYAPRARRARRACRG